MTWTEHRASLDSLRDAWASEHYGVDHWEQLEPAQAVEMFRAFARSGL